MNVLIIGANGFLGSHIVKKCLSENNKVYAVSLHTHRLDNIMNKIQFSNCNMDKITTLTDKITYFSPQAVINCAWDGGNNYTTTHKSSQFHKNLPGLAYLMEIIKRTNIQHFIGIGSGSEYGDKKYTIAETTHEVPINLYGTCKLMAKLYTEQFCKTEKIKWTWLRPIYIYGSDDVKTRLIPKTIISCLKHEEVLLNSCQSLVDYLYIDDFTDAVYKLISNQQEGLFNVCSNISYKIKNVVEQIGTLTNNKEKLNFGSLPERNNYPSIILGLNTKLVNITGWTPKINMEEGLAKTIEFYKHI